VSRWFLIAGGVLVLIGLALKFAPWTVNWFGRLPGDLSFGSGNTRVFIPLTSMIVLSLALTVIVNLFRR
jgi:hypothetical protein